MPVTVAELIGLAVGTLLCGLPLLIYGATAPPTVFTVVALAVAAVGRALWRPGAKWQTGGGVGFGWAVVVIVQIILDTARDPTSHNLAPFEILLALFFGLPPAVLGVLLGNFVRRKVPWPEVSGLALATLVLVAAVVHARATASDLVQVEALAQKKVAALVAAQYAFRAAHPLHGFTCDLGELGVPFSGPVNKNHPSESYRLAGVAYRGGTAAFEGEYRYSLKCEVEDTISWRGKPDPQERFVLTANPYSVGSRPLGVFCAGPDGAIRSIRGHMLYSCFTKGRIVQNLN